MIFFYERLPAILNHFFARTGPKKRSTKVFVRDWLYNTGGVISHFFEIPALNEKK